MKADRDKRHLSQHKDAELFVVAANDQAAFSSILKCYGVRTGANCDREAAGRRRLDTKETKDSQGQRNTQAVCKHAKTRERSARKREKGKERQGPRRED